MDLLLLVEWLAFAAASMHVLYLILYRRESARQEAPEDAERKAQVDAAAEGAETRHSETRAPLANGGAVDVGAMGFTSEEVSPHTDRPTLSRHLSSTPLEHEKTEGDVRGFSSLGLLFLCAFSGG